jgi:hypothetical protein
VGRVATFGTVDEKRTFVRAFLKEIEFDPRSRTGTAYLYAVPSVTGDIGPDPGGGTRYEPATSDSDAEGSGSHADRMSSLPLGNVGTRYAQKRTAPTEGDSSLIMVAGAVFVPDSYSQRVPLLAAHWVYGPARQGARGMRRIGLAA